MERVWVISGPWGAPSGARSRAYSRLEGGLGAGGVEGEGSSGAHRLFFVGAEELSAKISRQCGSPIVAAPFERSWHRRRAAGLPSSPECGTVRRCQAPVRWGSKVMSLPIIRSSPACVRPMAPRRSAEWTSAPVSAPAQSADLEIRLAEVRPLQPRLVEVRPFQPRLEEVRSLQPRVNSDPHGRSTILTGRGAQGRYGTGQG